MQPTHINTSLTAPFSYDSQIRYLLVFNTRTSFNYKVISNDSFKAIGKYDCVAALSQSVHPDVKLISPIFHYQSPLFIPQTRPRIVHNPLTNIEIITLPTAIALRPLSKLQAIPFPIFFKHGETCARFTYVHTNLYDVEPRVS